MQGQYYFMKKTAFIFLVSAYLLTGCHPASTPNNSAGNAVVIDTTKMHAATQQPVDTSAKDGTVIRRYANGVIKERSYYVAGRRQGECQSFYPTGKMWSDDYFVAGLQDGSTISYYENGQKRYVGNYTKGKPSGIWTFYDNTGKAVRTTNYSKKQEPLAM